MNKPSVVPWLHNHTTTLMHRFLMNLVFLKPLEVHGQYRILRYVVCLLCSEKKEPLLSSEEQKVELADEWYGFFTSTVLRPIKLVDPTIHPSILFHSIPSHSTHPPIPFHPSIHSSIRHSSFHLSIYLSFCLSLDLLCIKKFPWF